MNKPLRLRGSGGGGGGGSSSPTIAPNNLLADDVVEFTLGLCEGPIAGLIDGPKSFLLDETPLVSAGGENNFNPFELHLYHGESDATPIRNALGGTTSNFPVQVALAQNTPVVRQTPVSLRGLIDKLEVRLFFNALLRTNDEGDQLNETAEFRIEYREVGTARWSSFYDSPTITIRGKTTSGYPKDFVKRVPRINNDWEVRVTKVSPDNDVNRTINLTWESYQAVTIENRSYDNLAVVRGLGRASDQFTGIPEFSGNYACKIIKVPSNYDVATRYYDGAWDGTFKLAHTDNPAWCLYDLLTNETYGLKRYYPHLLVDRFSFYDAARWCDELVPRPAGGYQPRFTYNDKIDQPRNAIELVYYIAAIFGAVPVTDLNGTVRLKVDKPELPVQIFARESVTAEGFQYAFTDIADRVNDLTVKFVNPGLDWQQDARQVTDDNAIERNGRIPDEMVAIGCNDAYEAQRRAYRRILQANTETITVTFQTARAGLGLEIFDVIGLVDPTMNWGASGRVKTQDSGTIRLRDPLYLPISMDLTLSLQTPSGVHELTVQSSDAATTELEIVSGAWPADTPDRAQFVVTSNEVGLVKPFRILKIEEDRENRELLSITALEQNVNKYSDVDNLASTGTVTYTYAEANFPRQPVINQVESGANHLFINRDGHVTSRILVTWDQDPGSFVEEFEIFYRRKDREEFTVLPARGRAAYIENVNDGVEYEIQVRAVNAVGRKSDKSPLVIHTVVGKTEPPAAVTRLQTVQLGADVRLTFDAVPDLDLSHYEVRLGGVGSSWDNAEPLGTTTNTSFIDRNITFSPATYHVRAVDTSGNAGDIGSVQHDVPAPSTPAASVSFDGGDYVINISPNLEDTVPVSRYEVRHNNNLLFSGDTSRFSDEASWVGLRNFDVTAINTAGQTSPALSITGNILAPAAPILETFIADTSFYLSWSVPTATLPISHYEIKNLTTDTVLAADSVGNLISGDVQWLGNQMFQVVAVDSAGNRGTAATSNIRVVDPSVTELFVSVSRSILKLSWIGKRGSLPIRDFVVRSGPSYASSEVIATLSAETLSVPVDWNGSRTFYVEAIDTAGNVSTAASWTETIDPPEKPGSLTAEIVDQNVHLSWSDPATELLVDRYRIGDQLEWNLRTLNPNAPLQNSSVSSVVLDTDKLLLSTSPEAAYGTTGATDGLAFVVPSRMTNQWFGHRIKVRVRAAKAGSNPSDQIMFTYSTNEVGDAGENWFPLGDTPEWFEFEYSVPNAGLSGVIDHYIGVWAEAGKDVGIWEIEVLRPSLSVQLASGTSITFPPRFLGDMRYFVTAIDEAGNEGPTADVVLSIAPPGSFGITAGIRENLVELIWENPVSTLPIVTHTLRRGSSFESSSLVANSSTNDYSFPADWSGTETFYVYAIDSAGNESPVQSAEVTVSVPTAPSPRAEVIDNNVLLRWKNGVATLPVTSTEIRKGASFATAEVLQQVDATFATFFEFEAGTYNYWLVNTDSAGNYGAPVPISTVVSEPPDFLLQTSYNSDLSGTKTNVIQYNSSLLFGLNDQETFEEHFQNNGFDSPQEQIAAGYPIFIQPIDPFSPSIYEEIFDVGGVLSSSIITVTPTVLNLAGDGGIRVDIAYRATEQGNWVETTDVNQVYAESFRFVRFRLTLRADSRDDLVEVTRIDLRLNVKVRSDAGSGHALATDVNGTQVNFKTDFVDIESISVTPKTTTPVIPVYDFEDIQNPTGFTVFLFDTNGNRVSSDFSWAVRGY